MQAVNMPPEGEGILYTTQSELIALQRDARLLKLRPSVIRSRMTGNYLSSFKGRGMEFDEARPYQPGDDIRNMDWRVTARTNKPHSKVFREERERPVLLWVDFRAPMFFGTRQCFKSVMAAKASALLGWHASQQGDRLGALLFSEDIHLEMRPESSKSASLHIIRRLAEFSQQLPRQSKAETQLVAHALKRLLQVARPGSLIYLISDFRFFNGELEANLSRLSRHNELVLIHVMDPLENELPAAGFYRVSDGDNEMQINTRDKQLREDYHSRFLQHQQGLQELCKKTGSRYLLLPTNRPLLEGLSPLVGR